MAGVQFDFFAEAADIDVYRSWCDEGSFFPDGVEQLIAGQDAAAMGGEIFQQTKFAHGGEDIAAFYLDGHGRDIDFEVAEAQNLPGRWRLPQAAQNAADAGHQLA